MPEPPEEFELAGEPFPVPEPVFRSEVPDALTGQVADLQPVEREPIEDEPVLDEDRRQEAIEVAFEDERLRAILEEDRTETIGAVLRAPPDKDERGRRLVDVVVFDYDRNATIEVRLDFESLEVQELRERDYQPPPTRGELEFAADVALEDERLPEEAGELRVTGILTCPAPEGWSEQRCAHRILDLRFGRFEEPLGRYYALVDLSSVAVLEAGEFEAADRQRDDEDGTEEPPIDEPPIQEPPVVEEPPIDQPGIEGLPSDGNVTIEGSGRGDDG